MKWTLFILIALSSVNLTYAINFDPEVINVLDDINQQDLIKTYPINKCEDQLISSVSYSPHDKNKLISDCAFALCGAPEKNRLAYSTNSNFQMYVNSEIKKELEALSPSLNQVLEKSQKNNLLVAQALESQLNNGKIAATPDAWSEWFKQQLSYDIFSKYFNPTIDLKKPIDQRYRININSSAKNLDPEFKKMLEIYTKEYENYIKNDSLMFLQKGLYTAAELKIKASQRLTHLKKIFNSKFSAMSTEDSVRISSDIFGLESAFKKNPIKGATLFYYLESIEKRLNKVIAPNIITKIKNPTCSEKRACQKIYQDYLNNYNLSQVTKKFRDDINNPKAKDRALNHCKAIITARMNQNSDVKKAIQLFNEVKIDMEKNVFSKFSNHSRNLLKDYFEKKIIIAVEDFNVYGKTPTDLTLQTKQSINNYLKSKDSVLLPKTQEEVLKRILIMGDNTHDVDAFMDKGSPCNSKPQLLASDSYVARSLIETLPPEDQVRFAKSGNNDLMFVSDFTCRNELRGKAIIAHELGHAINNIFSRFKLSAESALLYKGLRKCTTDNYIPFTPSTAKHAYPGDSINTEEDFADLFSFMTYKDNNDLFSCALLSPTRDEKQYGNLSLDLSISDVHSPNFYRLIMEMINKKTTVPVSCQKVLDSESSRFRFKKCSI